MMNSSTCRGLVAICLSFSALGKAKAVPIRLDVLSESELSVAVTLSGAFDGSDSDQSTISGHFDAEIDFDSQGRPIGSRIVGADLNASDVSLSISLGFPFGSLDVDTNNLHFSAFTPDAPPNPPVDPNSGTFDLDLHRFVLDGGTAVASSLFIDREFNFSTEPEEFTPLDGMTGTLTQPNGPTGGPVRMVAPIALSELVATIELEPVGTVDVFVELTGSIVAEGIYDPPSVLGDTDGDGAVTLTDLNNVRNSFGGSGLGDTNGDGTVDLEDLNAVRNNFGAGTGGLAVSEPATFFLLMGCLGSACAAKVALRQLSTHRI